MHKKQRLGLLLAVALTLSACSDGTDYDGMRTEKEQQRYLALNDSLLLMTPHALDDILAQQQQATDSLTWYDYYLMYGRHYLATDYPDSVLPYVERTLQYTDRLDHQTPRTHGLTAMALNTKGAYHYLMHQDADSTISLFRQAYHHLTMSDLKESLPDVSANIGDAYMAKNDMAEASRWYRRALVISDSLELPDSKELTLYMGLGRIYTTLHDFEQAKYYYEQTDRHFDEMKPNMQSYFLNNYGNYFYYHREYDKALETFKRLKSHLDRYYDDEYFDQYLCKINLADVYLNLHQTDSARYYVAQAEEYFRQQGVDVGIYYAHTIRIGIALQEKQYDQVARILNEEGRMNIVDPGMLDIRQSYMFQYYAAIGDYRKAYAGLRVNQEKSDSAEYHRKHVRSLEILTRLTEDTIRMHHQIEMNEKEIRYNKTLTIFWITLLSLLVIIVGLVAWFNHEHKRRLQSQLDILSLRMANARQRISPHFVFNVLNSRIAKADNEETDQLMMLAKLIRSNLDLTHKHYITLAEELDFVRQYVAIEQQSTGIHFNFSIDAPSNEILQQINMPSMLIQILVENAILHGLKEVEGEKQLRIKVDVDEQEARICVSDNGPGFDIRQYNSKRSRTGLNIIRTTVSIFNEEYATDTKMHFDIKNDNGCQATITIPLNINFPETQ